MLEVGALPRIRIREAVAGQSRPNASATRSWRSDDHSAGIKRPVPKATEKTEEDRAIGAKFHEALIFWTRPVIPPKRR